MDGWLACVCVCGRCFYPMRSGLSLQIQDRNEEMCMMECDGWWGIDDTRLLSVRGVCPSLVIA